MVAWEDVGESSSCLPQMCRQWMSAERNCTCTTTRPSGFLNAKHAIILSPRSARDEFCISILPYVDYTAIWVTALRTRKYLKVCLQVGQLFRRLLQLEEVIFLFFTHVLSPLFFWSTLLLSPAELISWKWEEERLWCPLLSHSAPRGPDWPLSEAPDTVPTWFSQPPTSQSPPCLC